jgi:MFS family permease
VPLQWLLLIRFMVGIGLGGVPVAFALFAEFCPVAGRGGWLIALQAFWTFGSMAEAAVAWGVLMTLGWRVLLALSAAPFGEQLPASFVVPARTCSSSVASLRSHQVCWWSWQ